MYTVYGITRMYNCPLKVRDSPEVMAWHWGHLGVDEHNAYAGISHTKRVNYLLTMSKVNDLSLATLIWLHYILQIAQSI